MNYNEYLMHLNRQFDESKVKRDKNGRFAKKASMNRIISGPDLIDISEDNKSQPTPVKVVKNPYAQTSDIINNQTKKSGSSKYAAMPDEQTAKLIENKMRRSTSDRDYKLEAKKYRKKVKRILSRLIKREISLRSAVTVINHATKERVNEFMKRNFRTGNRNHFL